MRTAKEILDHQFYEMRWRCLSLAADLDRLQNADGGPDLVKQDPRVAQFLAAVGVLSQPIENRAEKVQMLFSDQTP